MFIEPTNRSNLIGIHRLENQAVEGLKEEDTAEIRAQIESQTDKPQSSIAATKLLAGGAVSLMENKNPENLMQFEDKIFSTQILFPLIGEKKALIGKKIKLSEEKLDKRFNDIREEIFSDPFISEEDKFHIRLLFPNVLHKQTKEINFILLNIAYERIQQSSVYQARALESIRTALLGALDNVK